MFNWLKKLFKKPELINVLTPKGEAMLNYLYKVKSGEPYSPIQAYEDTINQAIESSGGTREQVLDAFIRILSESVPCPEE